MRWKAELSGRAVAASVLVAIVVIAPMMVHGLSCGHDLTFHLQSWLDAARQMRAGTLYPHWAAAAAWRSGEPRFLFYPPLSWMLGALLTTVLPMRAAPAAFVALCSGGAAYTLWTVARRVASAPAALLAASIYAANPYLIFTGYERAAYGELLAAVWFPLLWRVVLDDPPRTLRVAAPLGLLWLSNAPSGVMGSYLLVLLGAVRLARSVQKAPSGNRWKAALQTAFPVAGGAALGLLLVSFYLLPAAVERRFVQVDMAVIPNLRYQDNFLFARTDYEPHNVVTRQVSEIAVLMLAISAALLIVWLARRRPANSKASITSVTPAGASATGPAVACGAVILTVLFMLLPVSAAAWEHVPQLKFLQFPWRLLSLLAPATALSLALVAAPWRAVWWKGTLAGAACAAALAWGAAGLYARRCSDVKDPATLQRMFDQGHGESPTDEYTPLDADNDVLRSDNPGHWMTTDPQAYAPGTWQNPNEVDPLYDAPLPPEHTVSHQAERHLTLRLTQPEFLILNLRAFADWKVVRNGTEVLPLVPRDDGLIAVRLPPGESVVDVSWARRWDVWAGDLASGGAALGLVAAAWHRRRRLTL